MPIIKKIDEIYEELGRLELLLEDPDIVIRAEAQWAGMGLRWALGKLEDCSVAELIKIYAKERERKEVVK